jgi:hypothetical protein
LPPENCAAPRRKARRGSMSPSPGSAAPMARAATDATLAAYPAASRIRRSQRRFSPTAETSKSRIRGRRTSSITEAANLRCSIASMIL